MDSVIEIDPSAFLTNARRAHRDSNSLPDLSRNDARVACCTDLRRIQGITRPDQVHTPSSNITNLQDRILEDFVLNGEIELL